MSRWCSEPLFSPGVWGSTVEFFEGSAGHEIRCRSVGQEPRDAQTLKKLISNSTWFGESVTNNRLEELVIWCNSADAYEMSFDNLENGIYLLNGLLDKKNQHT